MDPTNFIPFTVGKTVSVFIDGVVGSESYIASIQGVRETLTWSGQFDDIQVTINSCGGDIAEGLGIYDLLNSYGVPITTVVIGQCCSAATIIFLAGSTRLIYENVVAFMVHQANGGGEGTADQLRTIADFIDSYNERMTAIYIEKTGMTPEVVAEWMSKDSFMTAQEALDNGFATAIQKPVTAKYTCSRPLPNSIQSFNQSQNSDVMKIIKDQWKRITASFESRLAGKVTAKDVTTSTGKTLSIEMGGDSYAEGDPVKEGDVVAPDGDYTVDGVVITVKDGKIEKVNTDNASADVTAKDETKVKADGSDKDAADDGTTADLATVTAERDAAILERDALNARVTTLEGNYGTVTAQMRVLLGSKTSADPKVPAPKGVVKALNVAVDEEDDEDEERSTMLESRKNRGRKAEPVTE